MYSYKINMRYRGPIESYKHNLFFSSVYLDLLDRYRALEKAKEELTALNQDIQEIIYDPDGIYTFDDFEGEIDPSIIYLKFPSAVALDMEVYKCIRSLI